MRVINYCISMLEGELENQPNSLLPMQTWLATPTTFLQVMMQPGTCMPCTSKKTWLFGQILSNISPVPSLACLLTASKKRPTSKFTTHGWRSRVSTSPEPISVFLGENFWHFTEEKNEHLFYSAVFCYEEKVEVVLISARNTWENMGSTFNICIIYIYEI